MRRKTVAKRLLHLHDESDQEDQEREYLGMSAIPSLGPRQAKRKTRARPAVNGDDTHQTDQTDDGPRKLNAMLPEADRPCAQPSAEVGGHQESASFTPSWGSLQSCSRAALVAMVMSMQKEMDSLREQIRCLTASGKLASTLESLLQRTQQWSSSSSRTTTPMVPLDRTTAPAVLGQRDKAGLFSGSRQKQNGNYGHNHHQTTSHEALNGGPPHPPSPPYQELISAELLKSCNTGTTAQKLTNDLLKGLYDRDFLASHSISGLVNSRKGQSKPALPGDQIQAVLGAVKDYFPGKTDSEIKGYIRQKLQNEAKRLRKKPLPLSTKGEEPVRRGESLITYT